MEHSLTDTALLKEANGVIADIAALLGQSPAIALSQGTIKVYLKVISTGTVVKTYATAQDALDAANAAYLRAMTAVHGAGPA